MALENLKAQIDLLLSDVTDGPTDLHAVYQKVMQELGELRSFGMPLPDDLVALERALELKFARDMRPEPVAPAKAKA